MKRKTWAIGAGFGLVVTIGAALAFRAYPANAQCIPAPAVLEFAPNGRFLQAWGGPGQAYEWPTTQHAIFVDDQDNVWLRYAFKGMGPARRPSEP
jgi:hypothetical protein